MTLSRKKPMKRGTAQLARTPMTRKAGMPRAVPPVPSARPRAQRARKTTKVTRTGPTPAVRALVTARDHGLCVRCGQPATNQDHRRGRGAGGTKGDLLELINEPAWLITLCGQGNTSGCHGWKENNRHDAEREGYRLPRNGIHRDAEQVPVLTRTGWRLFLNDGKAPQRVPGPLDGDARNAA